MSEEFSLKVVLEGIDDATDEIQSVAEGLRKLGSTNEEVVAKAKEVLAESRNQQRVLKAVAEESKVFGDDVMFAANQLSNVANFAGKVNNMFTQWNTLQTRVNTAQIALNQALENQRSLLEDLGAKFGTTFSSVDEAVQYLQNLRAELQASGQSTKEVDAALKQLEQSQKAVAKASQEAEAAQNQMRAQMVTMGIQAVGLVPQFMKAVDSVATFAKLAGGLPSILKTVSVGFTGLMGAMGPVGWALMGLSIIIPLVAAHWDEITGALKAAGDAIWNAVGPALEWLWNNILKPLGEFLYNVFKGYVEAWAKAFEDAKTAITGAWETVKSAFEAAGQWFNDNVVVPIQNAFTGLGDWFNQNVVAPVSDAFEQVKTNIVSKIDEAKQNVGPLFQAIKDQWGLDLPKTQEFVTTGLDAIKALMEGRFDLALQKVGEILGQLPGVAWEWLENARKKIEEGLNYIKDVFERIWNGICDAVKGAIDRLRGWVQDLINKAKEAFEWLYNKLTGHSIVPEMWKDIVSWTQWGVGEVSRLMSEVTMGVVGPKVIGGVTIIVNAQTNASPDDIARAVSRELVRNLRGMGF